MDAHRRGGQIEASNCSAFHCDALALKVSRIEAPSVHGQSRSPKMGKKNEYLYDADGNIL
jgi:hypothetical protein